MRLEEFLTEEQLLVEIKAKGLRNWLGGAAVGAGLAMSPSAGQAAPGHGPEHSMSDLAWASPEYFMPKVDTESVKKNIVGEFRNFVEDKFHWDELSWLAPSKKEILQTLPVKYMGLLAGTFEKAKKELSRIEDYFNPEDLKKIEELFRKHQQQLKKT